MFGGTGISMEKKNRYPLMYCFMIGMFILLAISVFNMYHMPDKGTSKMYFVDVYDTWMDFFNPVYHAGGRDPYVDTTRIYPPICYCFYWFVARFIPEPVYSVNPRGMRFTQSGMVAFSVYFVLTTFIFVYVISKFIKLSTSGNRIEVDKGRGEFEDLIQKVFILFILISSPFLYQFERANIIIIALSFLIGYLLMKDSKNKVVREIGLICLAVSACIKIYPAVFGLLLLKEKRWFDSVRVVIYGILLFFLPFAFMGGFDKAKSLLEALLASPSYSDPINYGLGNKINISNFISSVDTLVRTHGVVSLRVFNLAQKLAIVMTIVAIILAAITKEEWKTYALLTGVMVGYPVFSFMYCGIFLVIPLVAFVMQKRQKIKVMDIVYLLIFLLIFGVHIYEMPEAFARIPGRLPLLVTDFLQNMGAFLLLVVVAADVFFTTLIAFISKKKAAETKKTKKA